MPTKKLIMPQHIIHVQPELMPEPSDPLFDLKHDLVTNTWRTNSRINDLVGLEGQVNFWREHLRRIGQEDLIPEFDAWVEEHIAPYYPGIHPETTEDAD